MLKYWPHLLLQYKFRVMSASIAGISEASPESEEVSSGACPNGTYVSDSLCALGAHLYHQVMIGNTSPEDYLAHAPYLHLVPDLRVPPTLHLTNNTVPGDDWKRTWGRAVWPSKGQAAWQEGSWIATWDYLHDDLDDVDDDLQYHPVPVF